MRLRYLFYLITGAMILGMIPGCAKNSSQEITVLLRMMPAQERFFREQIIPDFEKQNNCKINIATFTTEWDIEKILDLEKNKKDKAIALVKTPFEMTRVLVEKGYIKELNSIQDSDRVLQDLAEYHPLASGLGYVNGKAYYLPRKLETRTLFYRKSKVADAVSKFSNHKDRITKELKAMNGYGLPADYALESDPSQWDFYDVYVVGSIWANEEYNGVKIGRLAHRGARYAGTALDLVDKSLQLGASKEDILSLTADKVVETYVWERAMIKSNLYNSAMWQEQWKGANIYNAIKDGKVFLTVFQQIDGFLVHGWPDDPSMPSYLPEKDDMGLCVMPKAVSFELDSAGKYTFEGTRAISTGGWWWGVPASTSDKNAKLAYAFARYITSRDVQAKECSRFGMIPVRKDIITNLPQVFDQGWVGDIFKTAVEQIKVNDLTTVPLVKSYAELGQNMIDAWYGLCVEYKDANGEEMNFSTMKMRLASDYLTKQKDLLKSDYPNR